MGKAIKRLNAGTKRSRFSKEFKIEAVRLLESRRKPAAQLAMELGVRRNQLYKWQAQLKTQGEASAFRGPGAKRLDEYNEVERLRRELKRVTEERDILKKRRRTSPRNYREVRLHPRTQEAIPRLPAVRSAQGIA